MEHWEIAPSEAGGIYPCALQRWRSSFGPEISPSEELPVSVPEGSSTPRDCWDKAGGPPQAEDLQKPGDLGRVETLVDRRLSSRRESSAMGAMPGYEAQHVRATLLWQGGTNSPGAGPASTPNREAVVGQCGVGARGGLSSPLTPLQPAGGRRRRVPSRAAAPPSPASPRTPPRPSLLPRPAEADPASDSSPVTAGSAPSTMPSTPATPSGSSRRGGGGGSGGPTLAGLASGEDRADADVDSIGCSLLSRVVATALAEARKGQGWATLFPPYSTPARTPLSTEAPPPPGEGRDGPRPRRPRR